MHNVTQAEIHQITKIFNERFWKWAYFFKITSWQWSTQGKGRSSVPGVPKISWYTFFSLFCDTDKKAHFKKPVTEGRERGCVGTLLLQPSNFIKGCFLLCPSIWMEFACFKVPQHFFFLFMPLTTSYKTHSAGLTAQTGLTVCLFKKPRWQRLDKHGDILAVQFKSPLLYCLCNQLAFCLYSTWNPLTFLGIGTGRVWVFRMSVQFSLHKQSLHFAVSLPLCFFSCRNGASATHTNLSTQTLQEVAE